MGNQTNEAAGIPQDSKWRRWGVNPLAGWGGDRFGKDLMSKAKKQDYGIAVLYTVPLPAQEAEAGQPEPELKELQFLGILGKWYHISGFVLMAKQKMGGKPKPK